MQATRRSSPLERSPSGRPAAPPSPFTPSEECVYVRGTPIPRAGLAPLARYPRTRSARSGGTHPQTRLRDTGFGRQPSPNPGLDRPSSADGAIVAEAIVSGEAESGFAVSDGHRHGHDGGERGGDRPMRLTVPFPARPAFEDANSCLVSRVVISTSVRCDHAPGPTAPCYRKGALVWRLLICRLASGADRPGGVAGDPEQRVAVRRRRSKSALTARQHLLASGSERAL